MSNESSLRSELLRILEAVKILSPSSFTFAGTPSTGIATPMFGLQLDSGAPPLAGELTNFLYQYCFSNQFTGEIAKQGPQGWQSDAAWMKTLSEANQSCERWEDGWQVASGMTSGQVVAKRGAIVRILSPGEFVNLTGSGMALAPGIELRVYVPRDSITVQPGYYYAYGESLSDSADDLSVVRFYWNVSPEGAVQLLRLLSSKFNRWRTPFRFKTATNPARLARSDSGVLYVPRRYAVFAHELITEIHSGIREFLRPAVPLFTLGLARGLAFAEDPGTQESFGMSRCRLLAHGIWLAHEQGARTSEERLLSVQQYFGSQGISFERPWLNAGSADELGFPALASEAAA